MPPEITPEIITKISRQSPKIIRNCLKNFSPDLLRDISKNSLRNFWRDYTKDFSLPGISADFCINLIWMSIPILAVIPLIPLGFNRDFHRFFTTSLFTNLFTSWIRNSFSNNFLNYFLELRYRFVQILFQRVYIGNSTEILRENFLRHGVSNW